MTDAQKIVATARSYIDTPFHHQGRLPGIGLDCAGLVICVARALDMVEPDFDVPTYDRAPDGSMIPWCRAHMVQLKEPKPGDVIVVTVDRQPQHMGIVGDYRHGGHSIIHAHISARPTPRVIETRLMYSEALRFVAAFRLPEVGAWRS